MKRKRWLRWSAFVFLFVVIVYAATSMEAYYDVAYVSETTGSRYGYHLWPGGLRTGKWSRTSHLERYLAGHLDDPVENRWSRCSYMGTTIFGTHISFADGPVGGMVHLRDSDMQLWIDHHSPSEVIGLYKFLRTAGVEESQKRADEILEEIKTYNRTQHN